MMMTLMNSLTDVPGIRVGHATNLDAATGCTVIICPDGTIGGVDQRGGAPGTRETDLLSPMHLVQHVHAVLLAGGSAYGLAAADGVMRYLEEHAIGYKAQNNIIVPIVPAAILFDLALGRSDIGEMQRWVRCLSISINEGSFARHCWCWYRLPCWRRDG